MTSKRINGRSVATIAVLGLLVLCLAGHSPTASAQEGSHLSLDQTITYICDKINGAGEQPNLLLGKQTFAAKRVGDLVEIEETYSNPWNPKKLNKVVRTVDFGQLDPREVTTNGKSFSVTTVEKRKAIKEVWTTADGAVTEKSASLLHLVCSDETAARRMANAFKHAIELSHGPGSKTDPFDK